MSGISFTGIGSGLQISEIVNATVNAERAPATARINRQQAEFTADISAVGSLKGALEEVAKSLEDLADPDKYQTRTADGDDDFISISAEKEAQLGTFDIKVDNLAKAHKIMSDAIDSEEAVGEGTMAFTSGENSFSVDVSDTDTLADIRDKINDSADNESVIATIITDDNGQRLVMTSKETGLENAIDVSVTDTSDGNNLDNAGLSRLSYTTGATNLNQVNAAEDAQITIDGTVTVTSSTNEFSNVIDGVDLTVNKVHDVDDDISNIKITQDDSNIKSGLAAFVKSYNDLVELSDQLGQASEGSSGPLAGDSMLRGVMNKLRNELATMFDAGDGSSLSLSQIGVRSDQYGKLKLEGDELDEVIEADPDRVQHFFIGTDEKPGFAASMDELLGFYTESDGLIPERIKSKEAQLEDLDDDLEALDRKMQSLEARLYSQYNAMDSLVAGMNSTSSYLMSQLNNMPGVVRDSS